MTGPAPVLSTGLPRVIALVCSAGGLDALTRVLAPLPADLPAAVVVLQHQAPARRSWLAPILARRCRLPVRVAGDGESLVAGQIVVVPPGAHALATKDGRLALIASDGLPPYRPSGDLLLSTLAVTFGRGVVAVILSGCGNDGATGAVAVRHFGGVVLAADEASSAQPEMPAAAVARGAVDTVLPVDRIAAVLTSTVRAAPETAPTAESA